MRLLQSRNAVREGGARPSYDAIVDACCSAWNALMRRPEQVTSITTRAWAQVKL